MTTTTMTVEDVRTRVAGWQSNLLENAARDEREAGQYAAKIAQGIRQNTRDLRHRARAIGNILAILRTDSGVDTMAAALEARRSTLLASAGRLPPRPSYGPARRRLYVAAEDCQTTITLLREVAP